MSALETAVFEVTGMHCGSCGMLIDEAVEEIVGVRRSETNVRRGETTVEFDPGAVVPSVIIAAIRQAGYECP